MRSLMGDVLQQPEKTKPTDPGFYKYSGGRQSLIFLLTESGQWYAICDNGTMDKCVWGYIEQALSTWDLVRIK